MSLGFAIGFAFLGLIAGLVLALFLLGGGMGCHLLVRLSKPFQLGDRIRLGRYCGVVEKMDWKGIWLRCSSGDLVFLPPALLASQPVVRMAPEIGPREVEMRLLVPSGIEPRRAQQVARQAVIASPYLALDRPLAVSLEPRAQGLWVHVRAGVFDASQRSQFESSVIAAYQAGLNEMSRAGVE